MRDSTRAALACVCEVLALGKPSVQRFCQTGAAQVELAHPFGVLRPAAETEGGRWRARAPAGSSAQG